MRTELDLLDDLETNLHINIDGKKRVLNKHRVARWKRQMKHGRKRGPKAKVTLPKIGGPNEP